MSCFISLDIALDKKCGVGIGVLEQDRHFNDPLTMQLLVCLESVTLSQPDLLDWVVVGERRAMYAALTYWRKCGVEN